MESAIRRTRALYGIDNWGRGYFDVARNGRLLVHPRGDGPAVDLWDVMERALGQDLQLPLLVRFPQILRTQIEKLHEAFESSRKNFPYSAPYRAVFPLKVNNRRKVVEEILAAGRPHAMGLEVGSKAELLLALGLDLPDAGLLICNGFKDAAYVRMAVLAALSGHRVVLVVEHLREIDLLESAGPGRGLLEIGLRGRLASRGSGKWEATGGETGKFGMGAAEILHALERIRGMGMTEKLSMLHFHLGSQITEIRRIKAAAKEAARLYAKMRKTGFPITWLNVGGGLGVDYDGSESSGHSSVNYSVQEYANDIVYNTREVCLHEEVPLPGLVSESGRFLAAYHSLLLVDAQPRPVAPAPPPGTGVEEHPLMAELEESARIINAKNFREYYHDALLEREELQSLFELGYLSLEARARAEATFRDLARRALEFARREEGLTGEFQTLERAFRRGYVANFSVFRSLPDAWSVKQLFPILPIHRLNEDPEETGILLDLTCDSDGKVDRFVDPEAVKEGLELHGMRSGEPYVLAICLLGAYQDVMGNEHNLLGVPDEVVVRVEGEGEPSLETIPGDSLDESVARGTGWEPDEIREALGRRLQAVREAGRIDASRFENLIRDLKKPGAGRSYLDPDGLV